MSKGLCVVAAVILCIITVNSLYVGDSCIAEDQAGTCTLISKCQHLLDMIASAGRPIPKHIGIKLMERSCGGFEGNDPIVCCTPPSGDKKSDNDVDSGALTRNGGEIPGIWDHKLVPSGH